MFLFERNTFRRGLLSVPLILLRTRPCILLRTAFLFGLVINSSCLLSSLYALLSCFTFFLTYIFDFITNTFPFISIRLSDRSDICSYFIYKLFIVSLLDFHCVLCYF